MKKKLIVQCRARHLKDILTDEELKTFWKVPPSPESVTRLVKKYGARVRIQN